jgi:prepilin-type N-terminal cleavage/methylation domain-containing protein
VNNFLKAKKSGFSLIELLLAIAMFALFALGFGVVITRGMDVNVLADEGAVANQYASEGIEAVRSIKNQSFAALANTSATGVVQASSVWTFSGTSNDFAKYHRVIKIEAVNRTGGNIVTTGGTLDPDTKKITSTVTWLNKSSRAETLTLSTYLTNWRLTIVTAPTPPVIPPLPPPPVNWALATISATFDLTLANSGNATADGLSIVYDNNKVYFGRINGAGSEFIIFDVTTPDTPTILGRRDLLGNPNDIVINGNYAYIASSDNTSELQILDISNPATIGNVGKLTTVDLTVANSQNATADALRVGLSGTYLYMLRNSSGGRDFLVFNLTNPTAPGNPVGVSTGTNSAVNDMAVSGNYAYVTSTSNNDEFQVIDATIKTAPVKLVSLNLNSGSTSSDGLSVTLAGATAFVGRVASGAAPELYAIDVTTPGVPVLSSTMEVGFNVTRLTVDSVSKAIFLSTADGSNELKIAIYTGTSTLPATFIKTFNLASTVADLIYSSSLTRLFLAEISDTSELQVIKP